jgi:uncharacterized protein (DUF927 family)
MSAWANAGSDDPRRPLRDAIASSTPAGGGDEVQGFRKDKDGLWKELKDDAEGNGRAFRVSGPFDVVARTRDGEGEGHGLLLRWNDRDGVTHEWALPLAELAGEAAMVRSRLASGGLDMPHTRPGRDALTEYLSRVRPRRTARTVRRVGWFFGPKGGAAFVLPGKTYGEAAGEAVILDVADRVPPIFRQAGTAAGWRERVAGHCAGNSRLVLSVSLAFAAPLLTLLGEEGGGVQLRGNSRTGKSTALRVASSVWGPPTGADSFTRNWRSTGNGLEGVAALHNDLLLPLDEVGQMDPRELGETAYMLANGTGKTRSQRAGTVRPVAAWRLLFLSTGEETLEDVMRRAGKDMKAGQEARFVDLPADAEMGMGLFEELHTADGEATTPGSFAEALTAATVRDHGTAGPAFLSYVVAQLKADPAWAEREVQRRVHDFLESFLAADAAGQARTVCRRFALAAAAGELATEAGITGWQGDEATSAGARCFAAWCDTRGSLDAREDMQAIERVRACIAAHGQARFQPWREEVGAEGQDPNLEFPPAEGRTTMHRLGWRRWGANVEGGAWTYYFAADGWREATQGLDPVAAARTLAAKGFLEVGPRCTAKLERGELPRAADLTRLAKPPEAAAGGVRCYVVRSAILATGGAADDQE